MLLVTGGAGFIGANFILDWLCDSDETILNLDKLTYAGNLDTLARLRDDPRHCFVRADIADRQTLDALFVRHRPRAVLHLAAESHVDRSIHGPADFVQTNVVGSFTLLEAVRDYWRQLPDDERTWFRFVHVSTDEVYGSLGPADTPFTETTAYAPNSPYSASKAGSDHLARAYFHTYGLPIIITHCSNNYGPYQCPEKFIPLLITNALACKPLPVYGDGGNVRDWLYVRDHCAALRVILTAGQPGETYNIGGWNEKTNLDVAGAVCTLLDAWSPRASGAYADLITFVTDRPGHDRRYAIDARKVERELGWRPAEHFESGLAHTVRWYMENQDWVANLGSGARRAGINIDYRQRA